MTRLQHLTALRDKVKAGECSRGDIEDACVPVWPQGNVHKCHIWASAAYTGSFDAAMAFHSENLPGWAWVFSSRGHGHVTPRDGKYSRLAKEAKCEENPARALLLADLNALIAQEGGE